MVFCFAADPIQKLQVVQNFNAQDGNQRQSGNVETTASFISDHRTLSALDGCGDGVPAVLFMFRRESHISYVLEFPKREEFIAGKNLRVCRRIR